MIRGYNTPGCGSEKSQEFLASITLDTPVWLTQGVFFAMRAEQYCEVKELVAT